MVSEQIQIKAERMFCGTFFRCSVERTEIVIQPVQFVFAQVRQCFGVTFPGEELGVPDHQSDKRDSKQDGDPGQHFPVFGFEEPDHGDQTGDQQQTDASEQMNFFLQVIGPAGVSRDNILVIVVYLFHACKDK